VSTVVSNSAAEKSGIQRGDIITKFNGRAVSALEDKDVLEFTKMVQETEIGSEINAKIIRPARMDETLPGIEGGENWSYQVLDMPVVLEKRPKSALQAEIYENENFGVAVREMTLDVILANNLDPEMERVVVHRVKTGGWSSMGSVRPRDVVTKIGNIPVKNLGDFRKALELAAEVKPPNVYFVIIRGGRTSFLRIQADW